MRDCVTTAKKSPRSMREDSNVVNDDDSIVVGAAFGVVVEVLVAARTYLNRCQLRQLNTNHVLSSKMAAKSASA